jgi:hypothetical protein
MEMARSATHFEGVDRFWFGQRHGSEELSVRGYSVVRRATKSLINCSPKKQPNALGLTADPIPSLIFIAPPPLMDGTITAKAKPLVTEAS